MNIFHTRGQQRGIVAMILVVHIEHAISIHCQFERCVLPIPRIMLATKVLLFESCAVLLDMLTAC